MGWVVMCCVDFDELYLDEITPMPKWLVHPFYRDCLTLSVFINFLGLATGATYLLSIASVGMFVCLYVCVFVDS